MVGALLGVHVGQCRSGAIRYTNRQCLAYFKIRDVNVVAVGTSLLLFTIGMMAWHRLPLASFSAISGTLLQMQGARSHSASARFGYSHSICSMTTDEVRPISLSLIAFFDSQHASSTACGCCHATVTQMPSSVVCVHRIVQCSSIVFC